MKFALAKLVSLIPRQLRTLFSVHLCSGFANRHCSACIVSVSYNELKCNLADKWDKIYLHYWIRNCVKALQRLLRVLPS